MGSAWQPPSAKDAYFEALEMLPGGGHRELEPGVLLVDRKDRVAVLHGTTDVVSYLPDGSFVVYMGGNADPSVRKVVNHYIPYTGGWLRDPLGGTPTWQCPDGHMIPLNLYGAYRVVPDGSAVGSVPAPPTQPVEGHGGVLAWKSMADLENTPLVPEHIAKMIVEDANAIFGKPHPAFAKPYPKTEAEAFSDPSPQVEGWKVREGIKAAGVDLEVSVRHPVGGHLYPLRAVIVTLNDVHGWTRERIADWLDTLDIDLTLTPVSNEATEQGA